MTATIRNSPRGRQLDGPQGLGFVASLLAVLAALRSSDPLCQSILANLTYGTKPINPITLCHGSV